jgi:hypothetical protein
VRVDVLIHLHEGSLGLWRPERHLHGTVQLDRDGEFGPRLFEPSHLTVQCAEAEVTVGHERAHAGLRGKGKGLAVRGGRLVDVRGLAMRRNLTEEAQGICLVPPLLVLTGERQRPLGEGTLGGMVGEGRSGTASTPTGLFTRQPTDT